HSARGDRLPTAAWWPPRRHRLGHRQPAQRRRVAGGAELQPHVRLRGNGGAGLMNVIKLGGSLLDDPVRRAEALNAIAGQWKSGEEIVLILGGDPTLIRAMVSYGILPVVSSVAEGPKGTLLNVNADSAAAAIAVAIGAEELIFITDVAGLLDGTGNVVAELRAHEAEALLGS